MSQVFVSSVVEFHSRQRRDSSYRAFLPLTPLIKPGASGSSQRCSIMEGLEWMEPGLADALAFLGIQTPYLIS